jgi:RNA polymerase sigma-70 factor (ECF subfamily)
LIRAYGRIFGFCLALTRNRALAEDLCQTTYLRALERSGELREPAKLHAWLLRLAKNLYLDHVKSPRNRAGARLSEDLPGAPSSVPDAVVGVHRALANMQAADRRVLTLVYAHGYSYRESAHLMGGSEASVRSRVFRARREFRERFER